MEQTDPIWRYKNQFFREFKECVKQLTQDEQIHFADTLYQMSVYAYLDPTDPKILSLQEMELLAKYRHKMRYFITSGFTSFIIRDTAHFEKTCQRIGVNMDELMPDFENGNLFVEITGLLDRIKVLLYIAEPKKQGDKLSIESTDLMGDCIPQNKRAKDFSRARQVLVLYYLFEAFGIRLRKDIDVAALARFFHGMLGWEYWDITHTQIYQLLKVAPTLKRDKKAMYEDLLWAKNQLALLNLAPALQRIDEQLKNFAPDKQ